jgi:hypothetical protein
MSIQRKLCVRSVSDLSRQRLVTLKRYSRLTYGNLLNDAVEALWLAYLDEGHELPELTVADAMDRAAA